MSFNHISDNVHGEAGRTLTREAILLLRAAAPNLDQRTRHHIVSLGCAGRRGCRAGRAKTKHQHSSGIPIVVGRRPNRHPATSTDNSRQRTLVAVTIHASLPPRLCQSNVNLDRRITGSPSQTGSAPPTLYVFNASSLSKPHAIEHLNAELIGYDIDAAVISETHLKKKHVDSCVNIHRIHRSRQWNNTDGISKHRLSPYNAHYLNYNFLLSFRFQYLMNMRFKIIQSLAIYTTLW